MSHAKEEECTICLEGIDGNSVLGIIDLCKHYYHDHCILQWSNHSNSCPTCRELFYKINIHDHLRLIKTVQVQDKLLSNDAINDIPREFISSANEPPPGMSRFSANRVPDLLESQPSGGVCSICSSSDYRTSLTRNLFTCQSCEAKFHQHCLGISSLNDIDEDESSWCCPICDCQQEYILTPAMIRRRQLQIGQRSRMSHRPLPNRIGRSSRSRLSATGLASHLNDLVHNLLVTPLNDDHLLVLATQGPISGNRSVGSANNHHGVSSRSGSRVDRRGNASPSGLVIHNENGELDDAFLYESDNNDGHLPYNSPSFSSGENHRFDDAAYYSPPPIINGGVILRKELKQLQSLTTEEVKSWELYDKAKLGAQDPNETDNPNREMATRRRRKKRSVISPQEGSSASLATNTRAGSNNSTAPTRISSLMSQIRKPSNSSNAVPAKPDITMESSFNFSTSPAGGSPSSSNSNFSPVTSAEGEDSITDKNILPLNIDQSKQFNFELSFNQKSQIQKFIRANLRPLYKRNPETKNKIDIPIGTVIKSEEDYININKSASRKIYSKIVSMVNDSDDNDRIVNEYFHDGDNNDNLKQLVDNYIQHEINQYAS